jgi:hypothetical protein
MRLQMLHKCKSTNLTRKILPTRWQSLFDGVVQPMIEGNDNKHTHPPCSFAFVNGPSSCRQLADDYKRNSAFLDETIEQNKEQVGKE